MTPWTVARQSPLSMGFSKQEYWNGLPFPSSGDLPEPGIEPGSFASPALAGRQILYHYLYIWVILKYSLKFFMFKVILNFSLEKSTSREMVW